MTSKNLTYGTALKHVLAFVVILALVFTAVPLNQADAATKRYTVTFKANGGKIKKAAMFKSYSKTKAKKSVVSKKKVSTLPKATRTGYTLAGWYTKVNGGSKIKTTTKIKGNKTYYAHWIAKSYKITFNSNGGSAVSAKTLKYGTKIGTLPIPTRSGYTFKGWYTKAAGGIKIAVTTKVSKAITYYAQWIKKGAKPTSSGTSDGQIVNGWVWVPDSYVDEKVIVPGSEYDVDLFADGLFVRNGGSETDILFTTKLGRPFTEAELLELTMMIDGDTGKRILGTEAYKVVTNDYIWQTYEYISENRADYYTFLHATEEDGFQTGGPVDVLVGRAYYADFEIQKKLVPGYWK